MDPTTQPETHIYRRVACSGCGEGRPVWIDFCVPWYTFLARSTVAPHRHSRQERVLSPSSIPWQCSSCQPKHRRPRPTKPRHLPMTRVTSAELYIGRAYPALATMTIDQPLTHTISRHISLHFLLPLGNIATDTMSKPMVLPKRIHQLNHIHFLPSAIFHNSDRFILSLRTCREMGLGNVALVTNRQLQRQLH